MTKISTGIRSIGLAFLTLALLSCGNGDRPTTRKAQYMGDTDMYNKLSYGTYSENPVFENGMSAQKPVDGTIARGQGVYDYPDSEAGYQMAKDSLSSPLDKNEENMAAGKYLYGIYCSACHGNKGDGNGTLVQNEKFLGVPNYKDRDINEGTIYHVIMHGRNLMGSHSSQLSEKERWQIVHYVEQLRSDLLK